jgi:hypothetical protein
LHRTIYFRQRVAVRQARPVQEVFEYNPCYYPKLDEAKVQPLPPDWNGACLGERPPHIVFTPALRRQAARIVGKETNPLAKARKIFRWVSANVKWNAEDEYCIIPSFVIKGFTAGRGDCGVQSVIVTGPQVFRTDITIGKRFGITGPVMGEFQWMIFNLFNNTNFNPVGGTLASSYVGSVKDSYQVTSDIDQSRTMQLAFRILF